MNTNLKTPFIILAVLLGICSGCTADFPIPQTPEITQGLTLYIPSTSNFKTRSDESSEELKYYSLFFFAFSTDGLKREIVALQPKDQTLVFQDSYQAYPIKLDQGIYRFYLVANIFDPEADESDLPQTENDLLEKIYDVPTDFDCGISIQGLPMSASNSDFYIKKEDGSHQYMTSEGFHYDGTCVNLYGALTFLYAKITVMPNDAFGFPTSLSEIEFSNLSKTEPILHNEKFEEYGIIEKLSLTETDDTETPDSYIFYIPERYISTTDPASQSLLSFKIGDKSIQLPLGEAKDDKGDSFSNSVPSIETHRKIVRGTHYRYKLITPVDIILEISDWSPETINLEIENPIYLQVEKQEYPVATGEVTEVWFRSDVENVYIDSPIYHYQDNDLPLYKFEKEYSSVTNEGKLKISVNELIPSSEYDNILAQTDMYDYFHIVAGPIHKRIKVTPLTLEYYLNVNPTNVPLDVSLRIASSEYEGEIPVTIKTNYPHVNVSLSDSSEWFDILNTNTENAYLKLVGPDNLEINDANPATISVESSGETRFSILFKGLNTGSDIWKRKKTLTLTVTGNDDTTISAPIPVTVNIIPLIQDYTIHFKADGWTNPHIYVYECLEFPADWGGTYSPDGGTTVEYLASKPIGYSAGGDNYVAVLEYSYTGAIAFKGWDIPINMYELFLSNGSTKPFEGYKAQGFYIFSDNPDSWDIEKKEKAKGRYSYDMDFCKQHRDEIKADCPNCSSNMNMLWPGIRMKKEDDGWFEFKLTGIATPGKALIMFTDGHSGGANRYPGAYEVGVPLFDYPSKEGWLYFNGNMGDRLNNQFSSTKPEHPAM